MVSTMFWIVSVDRFTIDFSHQEEALQVRCGDCGGDIRLYLLLIYDVCCLSLTKIKLVVQVIKENCEAYCLLWFVIENVLTGVIDKIGCFCDPI